MPPFQLQGIDHLVLRVRDLARSVDFYTRVLGCAVDRRRDDLGMVHLRAGAAMIDVVDVNGPLGRPGGAAAGALQHNLDHFCLRVDPFEEKAILAHLRAAGIEAEAAALRYGAEGEGPSIYCVDPDGNRLELKGPAQRRS